MKFYSFAFALLFVCLGCSKKSEDPAPETLPPREESSDRQPTSEMMNASGTVTSAEIRVVTYDVNDLKSCAENFNLEDDYWVTCGYKYKIEGFAWQSLISPWLAFDYDNEEDPNSPSECTLQIVVRNSGWGVRIRARKKDFSQIDERKARALRCLTEALQKSDLSKHKIQTAYAVSR